MKSKFLFAWLVLLVAALFLNACGGQAASARDFNTEDFIEALRDQGMESEKGDAVEQAFFSATGTFVNFDSGNVQVFEYDSAEALENDAALVVSDGGSIGTTMVDWIATPHFYKKGRLLVLYIGDDAESLNVLENVLGPQFAGR
jgi:hypothetical protein